jgi:hypothetical protein
LVCGWLPPTLETADRGGEMVRFVFDVEINVRGVRRTLRHRELDVAARWRPARMRVRRDLVDGQVISSAPPVSARMKPLP